MARLKTHPTGGVYKWLRIGGLVRLPRLGAGLANVDLGWGKVSQGSSKAIPAWETPDKPVGQTRYNIVSECLIPFGYNGCTRPVRWSLVPDTLCIPATYGSYQGRSELFCRTNDLFGDCGSSCRVHEDEPDPNCDEAINSCPDAFDEWIEVIQDAFDAWSDVSGIAFERVTDGVHEWDDGGDWDDAEGSSTCGDIRIAMVDFPTRGYP
jgi:hypothetical protein